METQITIFESGISDGIMSRNKKFYSPDMTQEEINQKFLETRIQLGTKYGFDGKKIFQALQKTETNNINYPDGKYIVLNEQNMELDDYWYEQLPADILIISNKFKKIVVGNQMADCPVIIAEDRKLGVTALSHCGSIYINRKLPVQTVQALQKEYNSDLDDIYIYIGSCAKKESYVYDVYPSWATNNEVWQKHITKRGNKYHIDITNAIVNQLKAIGIKNIDISNKDTITNDTLYSHRGASLGNKSKLGQNFVGFFYR